MARLIVTDADGEREIALTGESVIGRTADIPIKVPEASRRHCRVIEEDGAWFVEDLKSSNGTRVNGRKVTKFELQDGDEIEVGTARLRFLDSDVAVSLGDDDDEIELEISLEEEVWLTVLAGKSEGERIKLDGRATIGRKSSNTLVLKDQGVSGSHAEIVSDGDDWLVRDLGSTNGTFVDGEKIAEARIASGGHVRVGPVTMAFTLGDDEVAPATATMEIGTADDLEIFSISDTNRAKRGKLAFLVPLAMVAGVAGLVYVWIQQGGTTTSESAKPLRTTGNLVARGASFEPGSEATADEEEETFETLSDALDFDVDGKRKNSGESALAVRATDATGEHLIRFRPDLDSISAVDRLEIGGRFRTTGFSGAAGVALVWRDKAGEEIGRTYVNAPAGSAKFADVRGVVKPPYGTDRATFAVSVHDGSGRFVVDDVFCVRLAADHEARRFTKSFGVMLDPSGGLIVARDGEEIIDQGGLHWRRNDRIVSCRGDFVPASAAGSITEVAGEVLETDHGPGAAVTVKVAETDTGVTWSGTVDPPAPGFVLAFRVDLEDGLVTVANDQAVRHAENFKREDVTAVVVGSAHRAVRIDLGGPKTVELVTAGGLGRLMVPLVGKDFSVALQLDFSRELAEVTELMEKAQKAEVADKNFGEAMRLYSDVYNRYPFRKDLADRAAARLSTLSSDGRRRLDALEKRAEDIKFFKTFGAKGTPLREEIGLLAQRYRGTEIGDRIAAVESDFERQATASRDEEHARLAGNHELRGRDLMRAGASKPTLAQAFFRSVLKLVGPESDLGRAATENIEKLASLVGDEKKK